MSPRRRTLVGVALLLAGGASGERVLQTLEILQQAALHGADFPGYIATYGKKYEAGSAEYAMREALFHQRVAEIIAHNNQNHSWTMGLNHLTDWTKDELKVLRGHRPLYRSTKEHSSFIDLGGVGENSEEKGCFSRNKGCGVESAGGGGCCAGLICSSEAVCEEAKAEYPKEVDWSASLPTAFDIPDQGACGSCWAVAATSAIEMQASINTKNKFSKLLSAQNILSCTPNEDECGGTGGCQGATAELGFEWAKSPQGRVELQEKQEYTASSAECMATASSFLQTKPSQAVTIKGFTKIAENKADAMMSSLASAGPVVASIVGDTLQGYAGGIIDSCKNNWDIDHAVLMMGYGEKSGKKYWKVRNSWGKRWGEKGYFRLARFAPDEEEPCGMDMHPDKGVACRDKKTHEYPKTQKVCGTCGILSDTSYPVGTAVPSELLASADEMP